MSGSEMVPLALNLGAQGSISASVISVSGILVDGGCNNAVVRLLVITEIVAVGVVNAGLICPTTHMYERLFDARQRRKLVSQRLTEVVQYGRSAIHDDVHFVKVVL